MKLYEIWNNKASNENHEELKKFLTEYYEKEKKVYSKILEEQNNVVSGTIEELAKKFEMENYEFVGFIDGINESIESSVSLEELQEDSNVTLNIVWSELYKNMHKAKADWLYNLPEWENIYTEEELLKLTKEYRRNAQAVSEKEAGRNDPCPCGSGKKYKKCCGKGL